MVESSQLSWFPGPSFSLQVRPIPGSLSALLGAFGGSKGAKEDEVVGAAHAAVLNPRGTYAHIGYDVQLSHLFGLDREVPVPVPLFEGYPYNYAPVHASSSSQGGVAGRHELLGAACLAYMLRADLVGVAREAIAFEGVGPSHACMSISLQLREKGKRGPMKTVAVPESIFFRDEVRMEVVVESKG